MPSDPSAFIKINKNDTVTINCEIGDVFAVIQYGNIVSTSATKSVSMYSGEIGYIGFAVILATTNQFTISDCASGAWYIKLVSGVSE